MKKRCKHKKKTEKCLKCRNENGNGNGSDGCEKNDK